MKFMELEKALGAVEEHRRTGDFYEKEKNGQIS